MPNTYRDGTAQQAGLSTSWSRPVLFLVNPEREFFERASRVEKKILQWTLIFRRFSKFIIFQNIFENSEISNKNPPEREKKLIAMVKDEVPDGS